MNENSPSKMQRLPLYIACYALWLIFTAVTIWTLFQWRNALLFLLPIVGPWSFGAIDKFSFLLLGIVAFAWIFFLETYLREGIGKGRFRPRVVRIALIQASALGIAYAVQLVDWLV